jgi:hypothetical protein
MLTKQKRTQEKKASQKRHATFTTGPLPLYNAKKGLMAKSTKPDFPLQFLQGRFYKYEYGTRKIRKPNNTDRPFKKASKLLCKKSELAKF